MSEYIISDEQIAENQRLHGKKLLVMPVIVRCRDCKYFCEDRRNTSIGWMDVFVCNSEQWSTSSLMPSHKVEPDGFCWCGIRKRKEMAE